MTVFIKLTPRFRPVPGRTAEAYVGSKQLLDILQLPLLLQTGERLRDQREHGTKQHRDADFDIGS